MSSHDSSPAPLRLPTGKQIYDALMAKIEPDLVTDAIPGLKEKYKKEANDEKIERLQRYTQAFEVYDRAFAAFVADLRKAVDACRLEARKSEFQNSSASLADHLGVTL